MAEPSAGFDRHWLAWLDRDRLDHSVVVAETAMRAYIEDWTDRGYPAVLRRRSECDPDRAIPLGLALPPSRNKARLAFSVPPAAVVRIRPPLLLAEAAPAAPLHWQAALHDLADGLAEISLAASVYGSLTWQVVTGNPYLTADSDLDLLFKPTSVHQLDSAIACITRWEARSGIRADGEAILPGRIAVSWRELSLRPSRVLVKSATTVELQPLKRVLDLLRVGAA